VAKSNRWRITTMTEPTGGSFIGRVMDSPAPAMLMLLSLLIGVVALWLTPREEEPQIVVPIADVIVSAPGLSAQQVERQIAVPMEKLLYQIDGVEYVYSASHNGRCVVTVRYHVGEDREESLFKIYNKVFSNVDRIPAAVESWVVKPNEIDDVPIVVAALWSDDPERFDDHDLRRLAEELELELQSITATNRVYVTGGRARQIRVELDAEALAARQSSALDVAWAIQVSNQQLPAGEIQQRNRAIVIDAGTFLGDAESLRSMVVNVIDGVPVHLRDVARVIDGPSEPEDYTWIGFGPAETVEAAREGVYPAVFISVAKQKGSNAVWVASDVEQRLLELEGSVFPPGVHIRIIRDYGQTADQKVGDLIQSLGVAVLTVVVFIGVFLGWRPAVVVGLAVPICYGVALGLGLLGGYTINRVTLFALILALGLLVDDPITGVDNIERFFRIGGRKARDAIIAAMTEIRAALIMSTIAIILSFAPLFFITGMMGPYMGPMAFNVPLSVIASTVVAFLITPWMALKILRPASSDEPYDVTKTFTYRLYTSAVRPLIASRRRAWVFLLCVALVFFGSASMSMFRLVPLKLLPFDNKNEFQVVINMPEGTTLEATEKVARDFADYLRSVPEVKDVSGFVGTPSPMDFNGMVRQYYLRQGTHMADLRVTLAERLQRTQQSHALLLRLRPDLEAIARRHGADIALVEVPPGPPVIATIAAEIYGEETTPYTTIQAAAGTVAERLKREPFVVDVDTSVQAEQRKLVFETDKEKAALSGIATEDIAKTIAIGIGGSTVGYLQLPSEVAPLPIRLRLPIDQRSSVDHLYAFHVEGRPGITKLREAGGVRDAPTPLVKLGELGHFVETVQDLPIFHKNLKRVAYVTAEGAGRMPAEIILDMSADLGAAESGAAPRPLAERTYLNNGGGDPWQLPDDISVVWSGEGEWDITIRVFRDLGIAFGVALIGIFIVLYIRTGLASIAGIIILAIPLSMIGIMPGFWLLNQLGERTVAGYPDPVLFTATAMIGMIALAGIVVRNSLVLIEFIHLALKQGESFIEAIVRAGAIRMRPVFLTAGTTVLGSIVITLDPIFNGLAWAIIFGIAASTLFTLAVIPTVYYLVYERAPGHGVPQQETST